MWCSGAGVNPGRELWGVGAQQGKAEVETLEKEGEVVDEGCIQVEEAVSTFEDRSVTVLDL